MKKGYVEVESIALPSDFGSLTKVEGLVDKICSDLDVNEDYYGNVLIAVTEAVNNAILHGNKEDRDLEVALSVLANTNDFCFTIKDQGEGFDYNNLPDPTAPENIEKENGRGIYLMKSLAEAVEFDDNGRIVRVYFSKR